MRTEIGKAAPRTGRLGCALYLLAFFSYGSQALSDEMAGDPFDSQDSIKFVQATDDFNPADKDLRKWETPTVADLDQDGWVDLLLNNHGLSVQVVWNDSGRYAKPWDVLMGDMHGITVGDFDQDGLLEVVIARGGGSGSNARNSIVYKIGRDRSFTRMAEFKDPLAMMRGRTVKFLDTDKDGDLDLLNFAFPSGEKNGESENYIYKNNGSGDLALSSVLPVSKVNGQKVKITDFDDDGYDDILLYGHESLRVFRSIEGVSYSDVSKNVLRKPIENVSGIAELDFDNDGDFDLYIARGLEMKSGDTFYDAESQTWGFFTMRGKFRFEDLMIGEVASIENYQSPWPNKKLFTGESAINYKFEGETFSGKDIHLVSSDTLGWPDATPNKGLYVGYVGNERWRIAGESWSPMTAVVHGVRNATSAGDEEGPGDLLLENRDGRFVDVSHKAGVDLSQHSTGVAAVDIDNNGYEDLLVIPRGNLVSANAARIWLNRGDGKFEAVESHGVISPELGAIGLGVEVVDYNQDGKPDLLLGNERGRWHLFRNEMSSSKHFLAVDLGEAGVNQASRLGAVVSISACGLRQVRRSGSNGAPYSRSFNRYVHFGLGECAGPAIVEIKLSNGELLKSKVASVNRIVAF